LPFLLVFRMERLNIYQIYYNEVSKSNCYSFTNHYLNENCTIYFENKVISDLVADKKHIDSEYFGVFSHAFKDKMLRFRNHTKEQFEGLCRGDVLSFFGNFKQKSVFAQAESYHKGFGLAFKLMLKDAIGIEFNTCPHSIYIMQNHFVAKSEVYQDYVETMLNPCIKALENKENEQLQQIIWSPLQKYTYERQRFKQNPDLEKQLGIDFYPMHPFLLERLPSLYCTLHRIKKNLHLINY